MRNFYVLFLLFFFVVRAQAQTNDSLIVRLTGGNKIAIALSDIDVVTFDSVASGVSKFSPPVQTPSLLQSFPNPADINTTIAFEVTSEGSANITIFNLKGNEVRRLFAKHYQTGLNKVYWDGLDVNGLRVPSGTFFFRLSIHDEIRSGKLVLARE